MGTRFLIVTTDDLLGTSVVVEDNRQRLATPQAPVGLTTT